jgi:hypothetical protein
METKVRITKENPPIPGHYDGVGIDPLHDYSVNLYVLQYVQLDARLNCKVDLQQYLLHLQSTHS